MRTEWDVPIAMDDGLVLRADIFRPAAPGAAPRCAYRMRFGR
jgi:predicted acyl esterase